MVSYTLLNNMRNQSEITSLTPVKELETFKFLKQIYASPPKITIRIDQLEAIKANRFALFERGSRSAMIPKINVPRLAESVRNYKTNKYTSSFYQDQTASLERALQKIPVYVVVNSNQEIVLAQPYDSVKVVQKKVKHMFAKKQKNISITNEGKLGLFFMGKADAETYLKDIMATRNPEGLGIGLTLHCIGLDSAYEIMRQPHPNIGFKLVPNLEELKDFLTKKVNDPNLVFDKLQYQSYYKLRPILSPFKMGYLPGFSIIQNNEYYKGVPLYIVQYKMPSEHLSEKVMANISNKYLRSFNLLGHLSDEVYGRLINTRDFLLGCGQCSIMKGSLETAQTSKSITNYAFFSVDQANQFIEEYEKLRKETKHLRKDPSTGILRYEGSRANTYLAPVVMRPRIFVTNLEDFLERWEEVNLFKNSGIRPLISYPENDQTLFDTKETVFVPKLEPSTSFPPPISKRERFKQDIVNKYRKLKAVARIYTEA